MSRPLVRRALVIGLLVASVDAQVQSTLIGPARAVWREVPTFTIRGVHAMACDEVRGQVVLFGGSGRSGHLADTWIWDGRSWTRRFPRNSPSARLGHSMTFDPVLQQVILFGGLDASAQNVGDLWAWDGRDWRRLASGGGPGARHGATLCGDPAGKRVLLFGGSQVRGPGLPNWVPMQDTWEWDGTQWLQRFPATLPDARRYAATAFCRASGRVVMFGGDNGFNPVAGVTWDWNGTDWRRIAVSPNPDMRTGWIMAAEPGRKSLVLFGGGGVTSNTTWRWDGSGWQKLSPAQAPRGTNSPWLVADVARGRVIQISRGAPGVFSPNAGPNTWGWDGTTWTKLDELFGPSLTEFDTAYDEARDEIVVAGAPGSGLPFETWLLQGGSWHQRNPTTSPASRTSHRMAYHAGAQAVVLVGGFALNSLPETWLWDGTDWTQYGSAVHPALTSDVVYDAARDRLVLIDPNMAIWEWEPVGGWVQRNATRLPPKRQLFGFAYDPRRRETVLYGGIRGAVFFGDTWVWDGTNWHLRQPPLSPPEAARAEMAFVPWLGGVALVNGERYGGNFSDTWVWDGTTWRALGVHRHPAQLASTFPVYSSVYDPARQRWLMMYWLVWGAQGPPTSVWELSHETLWSSERYPRPGQTIALSGCLPGRAGDALLLGLSAGTWPGIPLRPVPGVGVEHLPLQVDALLLASLQAGLVRGLDAQGCATFPLVVPVAPALLGAPVFAAGFSVSASGAVSGITNAVELQAVR